ncbi:MAG: ATP-dependent DNA helicase [Anaerolineae bacterium]|nr:ATP-dependent DNA helicase [Anaerolineales bacterium]MCQ3975410.1 ATP-dependent DNA helicase [Anaerolineae bacterium]
MTISLKTSVRTLVEFVLREGDLFGGGFQGPDRALLGSRGHRRLQKSRPTGYQAEVTISHLVETPDLTLEIFGRIDGIFGLDQPITLEEIKTITQDLPLVTGDNPLHWGQAQCYAYMYARQHNLAEMRVQLTYYHLDSQETLTFRQNFTFSELESFFTGLVAAYLTWMRQVKAWQERRDASIQQFGFPYTTYRTGQRDLAVAVYRAIQKKEQLFVQAPTGIGKTIATLFPAVKAIGTGLVARIFYLTAKTPGRLVAEQALDDMRQSGLHLKSVTLTAKEKICFCSVTGGEPEECPFTRNYYGKLKTALAETYEIEAFTRPIIAELAQRYEICPFEFSLDLALWADCIIGDYNYVFDPSVYLRRFFDNVVEPYLFLVDEAHNLPDRARAMYSAELDKQTVLALRKSVKPHLPDLGKALSEINQALLDQRRRCNPNDPPVLLEQERPEALLKALRRFSRQAEAWLALNQKTTFRPALLDFYFQATTYLRTAETFFGPAYISYFEKKGQEGLTAKLFCLDPAPFLAAALERSRAAIFFSGTLLPLEYFDRVLTGSTSHPRLILQSPFPSEHLALLIHNQISTRYTHRANSYEAVAALIEGVCAAQPGNYLIFFPSYAYLAAVAELVQERWPGWQLLIQERGMAEASRDAFLARFSTAQVGTLLGFAVMGGIFAEGIDLVGERLIGAIIVGVGLPQLSLERDLLKAYFTEQAHDGFAYAYQYPGLNRVMQAAGRVIRTEQDRGVILLIDERLTQPRYTRLFPSEWRHFQVVRQTDNLAEKLRHFWQKNIR